MQSGRTHGGETSEQELKEVKEDSQVDIGGRAFQAKRTIVCCRQKGWNIPRVSEERAGRQCGWREVRMGKTIKSMVYKYAQRGLVGHLDFIF